MNTIYDEALAHGVSDLLILLAPNDGAEIRSSASVEQIAAVNKVNIIEKVEPSNMIDSAF